MEFILLSAAQKSLYRPQLLDVMRICDKDFVPPLSARHSTSDTAFTHKTVCENGITAYLDDMLAHHVLAAVEDGALLGFVAFKTDYAHGPITADALPNLYICTLMLAPAARGRGLAAQMYTHLFNELYPQTDLYTRTWSTNGAHLKILSRFGFSVMARIENDRGNGIDTVYLCKKRNDPAGGV
jgi:ribosomal protein S18 acetylase RimI-like enzyme